ncbi:Disks large-like protein 1 [Operophtera brumata]|uniref:Disks large-like protein 1 n=1 Tax=Operophtera brumata TaxID=104452 RepID=A0A0L7LAX1_OPEBR|nr:Disks large-like protein 1 [Operophtera brumata]
MTEWMALFGLVWLLRVRGSLCGCAACKRARHDPHEPHETHELHEPHSTQTQSPHEERAPFDVIALQQYTRDATVQTDFDDEVEDLDKIELQITEESDLLPDNDDHQLTTIQVL